MTIWVIIWVVLMMFWLFYGTYTTWDPTKPTGITTTIIPWLCTLILGLVIFGGLPGTPIK